MKILYVSQYYPPEMGAPAARVSAFARRWAAAGHDVTVLTTFPNHPTGVIRPEYRGRWLMEEDDRGVRVVRTYLYAAANKGILKRSLCYASFATSSVVQGFGPTGRPDLIVATSPQFLVAMSGWLLSALKRVPLVLEVRDLWPDSIVAVGALPEDSTAVRLLRTLERFVYRKSDLAVSVTRSFLPHIREGGARRTALVTNGVDPELFHPLEDRDAVRRRYDLGDRFVACFAGTLGMAHGLEIVLDAAERLRGDPRFLFWLVGEGARRKELEAEARRRGLDNVRFQGQVPREEVPAILACADVALVLLRPDPLFETVLPSKIFEAFGAGRPVILGVAGESRELLLESGGGIPITPGDAGELVGAVRELAGDRARADELGRTGREFVLGRYTHDALAARYLEELQSLVDSSRR